MLKKPVSIFLMIMMLLTAINAIPLTVSAEATDPIADGVYYIKNKNSGLYLQVLNDGSARGTNVVQATGTGSVGQRWVVKANTDGSYRLVPCVTTAGTQTLDVDYGKAEAGTNIQIWEVNGFDAQNFKFTKNSDGSYGILTKTSNYVCGLNVEKKSLLSGANVIQWTYTGASNESWYFEKTSLPADSTINSGTSTAGEFPTGISVQTDYPVQQIRITSIANGNNLNISGTVNNSAITTSAVHSDGSGRWKLVRGDGNFFKIINTKTGRLLSTSGHSSNSGTSVILNGDVGAGTQEWYILGVDKDYYGEYLNYKIVNYKNQDLALTLDTATNTCSITAYKGTAGQKWRLHSDGLEGFAAYSKDITGREKASTIGGLLGEVVYVNSLHALSDAVSGSTPRTIVLSGDISATALTKVMVGKYKTIIGSYNSQTLTNIYFRCINSSGNIIFKNLYMQHYDSINANDDIPIYISNGNNYWIDHCTFQGHDLTSNTQLHEGDVDKLMYVGLDVNFVTVSYTKLTGHKYGLILGYPGDDESGLATYDGYPTMTIANNYFYNVLTRAPGLTRCGYFHIYNNYIYDFNLGFTPHSNSRVFSEKNYFDKGSHSGSVLNDMSAGNFTDSGSNYTNATFGKQTSPQTSFRGENYYTYSTMPAGSVPTFATAYAGSKTSKSNINYTNYTSAGVPSANAVTIN